MHKGATDVPLRVLARGLVRLERGLVALEKELRPSIRRVAPNRRPSARNLVHYIALRQHDLRDLQGQLAQRGLSSLGRSESCVMASLLEVSARTHESLALAGVSAARPQLSRLEQVRATCLSWETANAFLHDHTREVLGPRPDRRHIAIMVTAPEANEADTAWMVRMLGAGMNLLRINCAHEDERKWGRMIRALQEARAQTGKKCRVLMDLGGPKIRTGPIASMRHIATWKPAKDDLGGVTAPARVVIRRALAPPYQGSDPCLLVGEDVFRKMHKNDELRFPDARGKKSTLKIDELGRDQIVALSGHRAYVLKWAKARLWRGNHYVANVTMTAVDTADAAIDVRMGDSLVLTTRATAGHPPLRHREGHVQKPGMVSCTLPAALDHLAAGHRVLFDDGRIHAVVIRKNGPDYLLRIVGTQKESVKLRAEKGINLPDTRTKVPSLTVEDRRALAFVAKHADAVSLSFVRSPIDVRLLHAELDRLGRPDIAVVLKIETRAGFENLPRLLLEGLCRPPLAVMIARGDLAVEVGFERLAEIQEEILWLCEAAHVPAIWATQVLDTMARTGVPSRAEVTDAAASVAAECVMLNKGPYVEEAVRVLSDILMRMEKHHYKKRSLFRKLRVSALAGR